jgi:hypothetical protein
MGIFEEVKMALRWQTDRGIDLFAVRCCGHCGAFGGEWAAEERGALGYDERIGKRRRGR